MNIIVTPRLLLRPLSDSDLYDFLSIHASAELIEVPGVSNPLQSIFQTYIDDFHRNGWGMFALVDRREKKFIGICGLQQQRDSGLIELLVQLAPEAYGKGYATEAAKQIIQRAFLEWDIDHIVAISDPDNGPAIRVMKKLGMSRNEIIDSIDTVLYEIRSEQAQPPMRPFRQTMIKEFDVLSV